MNATLRRIAVSGSAAVALLGGAAAITLADSPTASATEFETAVNRATGAPVNLPDGRTLHVRGLDAASYTASAEQHSVVVLAAAKSDDDPAGISNGTTPDGGSGAALTNPNSPATGTQTGYNQQVTTQAGGGAVLGTGIVAMLLLGVIVFFKIKHHSIKVGDAILVAFLGVALSGTVFGVMAKTMTEQGVGSLGGVLSGLG